MRILLVDDMPDQVRKYQKVIKELGHEVEATNDSRLAWELLQSETFDAMVSDVQMPIMSGVDLVWSIFYLNLDLPCLLHSSEAQHSNGHEWIDLSTLHEELTFVTFHRKHWNIDPTYISEFLATIKV